MTTYGARVIRNKESQGEMREIVTRSEVSMFSTCLNGDPDLYLIDPTDDVQSD